MVTMIGGAYAAPYHMPQPSYGELTTYDWQPVYSLDGMYNFSDEKEMPNTVGTRLNFSLCSDSASTLRHQFTVSIGYDGGKNKRVGTTTTVSRLPLTLGYDANIKLTDHFLLDLGGRAGYAWGFVSHRDEYGDKIHESTGGFTFGLGAGVKVKFSEAISVKLGYEFNRTFYRDLGESHFAFGQHGIVVGAEVLF